MAVALRLKMCVGSVKRCANADGSISQEELSFSAVYGQDGTVNSQWSKWTPYAQFNMTVSNPEAFGKILPGQFVFVDITPCEKDSI